MELLDPAGPDELIDLPVGVAGQVRQRASADRSLVQAMNRHDRERLTDRPAVGQRLEDGEVAEVDVGERLVERRKLLRNHVQVACEIADPERQRPEDPLDVRPVLERHVAEGERGDRLHAGGSRRRASTPAATPAQVESRPRTGRRGAGAAPNRPGGRVPRPTREVGGARTSWSRGRRRRARSAGRPSPVRSR